ncbi:hypothetical protein GETHLI_30710 [Geothrix limicola]|uniref:Uncharacterized protein n=2 Tax=Geothrix limicola TaxID=2927978 RepID=A0ABQ5QJ12_9BACT|nr:hypothetical protein GETHLI_30710 [Geothrix limicola]
MAMLMLLSRPAAPPLVWLLLFIPVVFLATTWITNHFMGTFAMYRDWPADPNDVIEQNAGWQQVEFGAFRGHCPMSIKFGRRCLHLKQPFPFQPLFWLGPASIPWSEVLLEKEPKDSWWAFLSPAEFRLGAGGRMIRLRGKAAKTLMEKVREKQGQGIGLPPPMAGSSPIRPK